MIKSSKTSKIESLRSLILLMAAVCFALPSWGVLSEYNLDQTLISLSTDMVVLQQNVRKDIRRFENRQVEFSAGNDPKLVRKIILDSFHDIDGVVKGRKHVVIMRNFGGGIMRIELKVWIDSEKYLAAEPAVREAIFEAFRRNDIQGATFLQHMDSKGTNSIMTNNITIL